nr:PcfJ domain-containing protein [Lachnospiraceae bacterium]
PFDLSSVLRLRGDSVYSLSSGSFSDELSRYTQAHALLFPAPYTGKYPLLPILGPFYHPYFELLCKAGLGRLADHLLEQLTNGPSSADADSDSETAPVYPPLGSAGNPREIYGLSIQCLRKAQIWSALPEFPAFLKNLRKLYTVSPSCADLSHYSLSWTLMIAKHLAVCSDPADGRQRLTLSFFGDVSQKQLLRISRYLMALDEAEPEREHLSAYMAYCARCSALQLWPEGLTPKDLSKAGRKTEDMCSNQAAVSHTDSFTARILSPDYIGLSTKKEEEDPLSPLYDQKYTVRVPLSPADMTAEAAVMRSCLASYIPNVLSGASRILFLRKRSSPDKPFVTLEVSPDGRLLQAKSFANGRLAPSVKKYLAVWAMAKGVELNTADVNATA